MGMEVLTVSAAQGEFSVASRPIAEGWRRVGWGQHLHRARGTLRGLPAGHRGGSAGDSVSGTGPGSCWACCPVLVDRSRGQQETGWNRGLGLKMQFFFFVQPSGGDLGGVILRTPKST